MMLNRFAITPRLIEALQQCQYNPHFANQTLEELHHVLSGSNHLSPSILQPIFITLLILLKSNISLLWTIRCLNRLQPFVSHQQLTEVHQVITDKYPPWVDIHFQVQQILGYNTSLLPSFMELMESVEQWYKGVMEHHQCCHKEGFLFLLDHAHAVCSVPQDTTQMRNGALAKVKFLVEMTLNNHDIAEMVSNESNLADVLLECAFKIAHITNCLSDSQIFDTFTGQFRDLMSLLNHAYEKVEVHLTDLLMIQVRSVQCKPYQEKSQFFEGLVIKILNTWLLFKWSKDRDFQFLWALKTAGDLLNIPLQQQKSHLIQLHTLFHEVNTKLAPF